MTSSSQIGQERRRHLGDQWHYALSRIAVVCRAYGLRPIDGPFGDFTDPEGYMASAHRAAVLGYEGKWAIHPSQIALANDVFTPSRDVAERTRRIIAAMQEAAAQGKGAVSLANGRLIDAASIPGWLKPCWPSSTRSRRAASSPRRRFAAAPPAQGVPRCGQFLVDPRAEQRRVLADRDHPEARPRARPGLLAAAVAVHAGDDAARRARLEDGPRWPASSTADVAAVAGVAPEPDREVRRARM